MSFPIWKNTNIQEKKLRMAYTIFFSIDYIKNDIIIIIRMLIL